jgi:hypothetical protein
VKLFLSTLHFRHLRLPGQVFCHFWVSQISGYVCEQGEAAIFGTHDNTDLFRKLYPDGALDKHKIELNLPDERTQLPVDIVGGGGLGFRV